MFAAKNRDGFEDADIWDFLLRERFFRVPTLPRAAGGARGTFPVVGFGAMSRLPRLAFVLAFLLAPPAPRRGDGREPVSYTHLTLPTKA